MSPIATIAEIGKHDGQTVTIRGWLYNLRESGKLCSPSFATAADKSRVLSPRTPFRPKPLTPSKA